MTLTSLIQTFNFKTKRKKEKESSEKPAYQQTEKMGAIVFKILDEKTGDYRNLNEKEEEEVGFNTMGVLSDDIVEATAEAIELIVDERREND